jgi:hypothetical protein
MSPTFSLPEPSHRRLRTYAFDPTMGLQLETAVLNQQTLRVKWEKHLQPGPMGEYLEVIDHDPASKAFYAPVDLNDLRIVAQDGLNPSEGSPQFHQQMVYAVAMNTISHFETALGRPVLWSPRRQPKVKEQTYVPRLRIYPHALRQANAFYDADRKALLFGYFPGDANDPARVLPGGTVFTCLSQDIVAHETTHAILDGIHRRYLEPTNIDALAFHEAFSDVVALFQHFSHPEALRHQIAKTRGDLAKQNLLGELAQQFGQATGEYGALRSAIGQIDPKTRRWTPIEPDPEQLSNTKEPHDRGAILVAAIFDAFLIIYKARVADLIRIASNGTGKLPDGDIHPDLVNRLADEASKSAKHVLQICIRALDYCPPVDLTFGEYLRALITADFDMVKEDSRGYRTSFIEAFRRRGIYPEYVRTMSEESLLWNAGQLDVFQSSNKKVRAYFRQMTEGWRLNHTREETFHHMSKLGGFLNLLLHEANLTEQQQRTMGIVLGAKARGIVEFNQRKQAKIEVHSLRRARRITPEGELKVDLVIELTQRRIDAYGDGSEWPPFRGGCTLLVHPDSGQVRYCISKDIRGANRHKRQKEFVKEHALLGMSASYFGDPSRRGPQVNLLSLMHEGEV